MKLTYSHSFLFPTPIKNISIPSQSPKQGLVVDSGGMGAVKEDLELNDHWWAFPRRGYRMFEQSTSKQPESERLRQ
jgi:hypothetical protein